MKPFGPKMPVFAVTAVAIVICLAATTDGQGQTSPTQRPSPARSAEAAVDQLFAQWNNSTSPGCSLGITRNGALVYERGHGMANLDLGAALTPASVFNVASVSKQFTAMAVLLLAKGGHLSLDDEVRKYIPELPDYGTRLTIRHLLTHTSGLRNAFGLRGLAAPRDDGTDENDEIVMMLARQRALDFTPGTRYTYNNGAYIMLGVLVKRVSGQSLRAFAEANIFKPLGMAHTHFHDDVGEIVPNRASGYTRGPGGLRVTNPADEGGFVGNAGLFTTVRDLLIWEQNFSVVRVGDPALVAAMQAPTTLTGGGISSYGFGLELGEYRGLRTVGHTGDEPGWVAHVVRFPSQEFTVALLCNFDAPAVTTLTRRIADIHLGDALTDLVTSPSEVATLTGPPVALAADDLAADVGFYRDASTEGLLRVFVLDGKLRASPRDDGDTGRELVPVSATRFRVSGTTTMIEFVSAASTGARELHFTPAGGKPRVFQRADVLMLSSAELQQFAGDYVSPEIQVTYTVVARQGDLMVQRPGRAAIILRPLLPDAFTGAVLGVVTFSRDAQGAITGFAVNLTGVRGLRFDRVKQAG